MKLSRRAILQAGATTAGAALAADALDPANAGTKREDVEVAIVGAGLSGLVAARTLARAGVDRIAVIEARDRVGGRTINHDLGAGRVAEGGGQWVGPTQTAILDLCREMGVETFPTHLDGKLVLVSRSSRFEAPYAESAPADGSLFHRIDALAAQVSPEAPWAAQRARDWDAITLDQWAEAEGLSGSDRGSLARAASLTLGTTPDKLSFLYFLYYVASAGSLHTLESMKGGAQDARLVGGSQVLSLKIATDLGDRVRLNQPVRRIHQTRGGVEIVTAGARYRARQVIIAMMPADADRIAFRPGLPRARAQLQAHWPSGGDAVKINVVYTRPFWRQKGLNGMTVSDSPVVPFTTDNSPPDGSLGVILILTGSETLAADPMQRRSEVLSALAVSFGDEALSPIDFHEMNWGKEAYTSHCVSGLAPGVLTAFGPAMRESIGRIHWAGTEAATIWTGYMDGAVRAGQSAAAKALAGLQSTGT